MLRRKEAMCSIMTDELTAACDDVYTTARITTSALLDERNCNDLTRVQLAKERTEKSLDRLRNSFTLYQRIYGRDAAREALMGIASMEFRSTRKAELLSYVSSTKCSQGNMHGSELKPNDNLSSSNTCCYNSPNRTRYLSYRLTLGSSLSSTATTATTVSPFSASSNSNATNSTEISYLSIQDSKSSECKSTNPLSEGVNSKLSPNNPLSFDHGEEADEVFNAAHSLTTDKLNQRSRHDNLTNDSTKGIEVCGYIINQGLVHNCHEAINSNKCSINESNGLPTFPDLDSNQTDPINISQSASIQHIKQNGIILNKESDVAIDDAHGLSICGNSHKVEEDSHEQIFDVSLTGMSNEMLPVLKKEFVFGMIADCAKEPDDGAIVPLTNSTAASTTSQSEFSATPSLATESNMSPSPVSCMKNIEFVPFPTITSSHSGEMMHCESGDETDPSIINLHVSTEEDEPNASSTFNRYKLGCTSSSTGSSFRHTKSFASTASESIGQSMKEKWMASSSGSCADDSSWTDEDESFFAGSSDPSFVPTLKSSCASESFFIKDSLSGMNHEECTNLEIEKIDKKIKAIDVVAWNTVERAVGIVEKMGKRHQKPKKSSIRHCGITSSSTPSPFSVEFMKGYLDYANEKGGQRL
jgi:hypothetical protein